MVQKIESRAPCCHGAPQIDGFPTMLIGRHYSPYIFFMITAITGVTPQLLLRDPTA